MRVISGSVEVVCIIRALSFFQRTKQETSLDLKKDPPNNYAIQLSENTSFWFYNVHVYTWKIRMLERGILTFFHISAFGNFFSVFSPGR
jgi:hypothetical protein